MVGNAPHLVPYLRLRPEAQATVFSNSNERKCLGRVVSGILNSITFAISKEIDLRWSCFLVVVNQYPAISDPSSIQSTRDSEYTVLLIDVIVDDPSLPFIVMTGGCCGGNHLWGEPLAQVRQCQTSHLKNQITAFSQVSDAFLKTIFEPQGVGNVPLLAIRDRWPGLGVGGFTVGGTNVLPIIVDGRRLNLRDIRDAVVRLR